MRLAKAVGDCGGQAVRLANAAKLTGSKVAELETGLEPTEALVPRAPDVRSNVENTRHWSAGRCWRGSCAVIVKPTDRQRTAATLREMVSRTVEEVRHGDP
ncbi:hypothetical protein ACIBG0_29690 [Nocardia sp. NPDC050630]|uniref:hypothetical protein n=1 Tax=Nocardia sp. NPDC050630 TaxID=3364321 RepID=UPI00379AB7B9